MFDVRSPAGPPQVGTLIFTENQSGTTLTMTIACASLAHRDDLLAMRIDVGTARTLDNLAAYLEKESRLDRISHNARNRLHAWNCLCRTEHGRRPPAWTGKCQSWLGDSSASVAIGEEYKAPPLLVAIRRHGQFAEYVPISILLLLLLELNHANAVALAGLAGVLVLSRLCMALGLGRTTPNPLRTAGNLLPRWE